MAFSKSRTKVTGIKKLFRHKCIVFSLQITLQLCFYLCFFTIGVKAALWSVQVPHLVMKLFLSLLLCVVIFKVGNPQRSSEQRRQIPPTKLKKISTQTFSPTLTGLPVFRLLNTLTVIGMHQSSGMIAHPSAIQPRIRNTLITVIMVLLLDV